MSFNLIPRCWGLSPPLLPGELLVLLRLVVRADENGGSVFLSLQRVASDTGLAERSVRRAMRSLEKHGLITCVGHRFGGRGHAAEYLIDVSRLKPNPDRVTAFARDKAGHSDRLWDGKGGQARHKRRTTSTDKADTVAPHKGLQVKDSGAPPVPANAADSTARSPEKGGALNTPSQPAPQEMPPEAKRFLDKFLGKSKRALEPAGEVQP